MRPRGETDITLGFGPSVSGSNPDEGTKNPALRGFLVEKKYIFCLVFFRCHFRDGDDKSGAFTFDAVHDNFPAVAVDDLFHHIKA